MEMGIVEQITHEVGEKFGLPLDDTTNDPTNGDDITVDAEMSSTNSPAATDTVDSEATSSKLANKPKNKSSIFSRKKSGIVRVDTCACRCRGRC
jgi:hypothetical protein